VFYIGRRASRDFEDEIKSFPSSLCFDGTSRFVGGHVSVYLWQILLDLVGVSFDLHFSSTAMIDVLLCWSFGALAR
jgi:hypothetical protein